MQVLYNSDNYVVVQFDLSAQGITPAAGALHEAGTHAAEGHSRGGYEIVDKFARKEIFIDGAMAQSFKEGVEALIETSPSQDDIDDYIGRYTSLMQQPVILH